MNTTSPVQVKLVNEYKIQLKGAYEGKYRLIILIASPTDTEYLAFFDSKIPLQVTNKDIIDLLKETIALSEIKD